MATAERKKPEDPVFMRIMGLIREQKKKEMDLAKFLGLQSDVVSKWNYSGSRAYLKYIDPICEYLETTPNYLFFGFEEDEVILTSGERELIEMYRKLDEDRKRCIRDTMRYFLDTKKIKKQKMYL